LAAVIVASQPQCAGRPAHGDFGTPAARTTLTETHVKAVTMFAGLAVLIGMPVAIATARSAAPRPAIAQVGTRVDSLTVRVGTGVRAALPAGRAERLLMVLPTCEHCHAVLDSLSGRARAPEGLPAGIVIVTGPAAADVERVRQAFPVLAADARVTWGLVAIEDAVTRLDARAVPLFLRTDADGVIVARGTGLAGLPEWLADSPAP
jgi:hypothetical protein